MEHCIFFLTPTISSPKPQVLLFVSTSLIPLVKNSPSNDTTMDCFYTMPHATDIIERLGSLYRKPSPTPIDTQRKLKSSYKPSYSDPELY